MSQERCLLVLCELHQQDEDDSLAVCAAAHHIYCVCQRGNRVSRGVTVERDVLADVSRFNPDDTALLYIRIQKPFILQWMNTALLCYRSPPEGVMNNLQDDLPSIEMVQCQ